MSTERQPNADSLSRVVAILTCLSLVVFSFAGLSGCSESAVKEPVTKKKPVQDLNIVKPNAGATDDGGSASNSEKTEKEDEIESLPFESQQDQEAEKEKELPELGGEG